MPSALPLFVYGTLRAPEVLRAVLGHLPQSVPAVAPNFRTVVFPGRTYPAIVDAAGVTVGGLLLHGLTSADRANLDVFEGNEYERRGIKVQVEGRLRPAEVYWPLLRIAADAPPWRYEDWLARHAQAMSASDGPAALRDRLIAEARSS